MSYPPALADLIYKILPERSWQAARARGGPVPWAAVDHADGFMHLSARHQVRGTADKHFAGQSGLVLLGVDPDALAPGLLKWEVSRGGDRFPHVYGDVPAAAVKEETRMPWTDGGFALPSGM